MSEPEQTPQEERTSLRGTMVSVALLAGFFVACWVGMLLVMLVRR